MAKKAWVWTVENNKKFAKHMSAYPHNLTEGFNEWAKTGHCTERAAGQHYYSDKFNMYKTVAASAPRATLILAKNKVRKTDPITNKAINGKYTSTGYILKGKTSLWTKIKNLFI